MPEVLWSKREFAILKNRSYNSGNYSHFANNVARTTVNSNGNQSVISSDNHAVLEQAKMNPNSKRTRRLSNKKMEENRLKSLCFWCNDKFTPGHKFSKKQLYMLTLGANESKDSELIEELFIQR